MRLGRRDAGLRVRLLSRLAMELHYSPAIERRRALTEEAIALAESGGQPADRAEAMIASRVGALRQSELEAV